MEDCVPPKIESIVKFQIRLQKIDDKMKGMLEDIYNVLSIEN